MPGRNTVSAIRIATALLAILALVAGTPRHDRYRCALFANRFPALAQQAQETSIDIRGIGDKQTLLESGASL